MAGTFLTDALPKWGQTTAHAVYNRPARSHTPLRHRIPPTDSLLERASPSSIHTSPCLSPRLRPSHMITEPLDMKTSTRKFSYASVKEEQGQDTPQSFESSLSSEELEEVEWISWPCSSWCKTKGLCSHHPEGKHEGHVETRLEGYARCNPRKLEKILDEIEKRRRVQKYHKQSFGNAIITTEIKRTGSDLSIWREKLQEILARSDEQTDENAILEDEDPVHSHQAQIVQLSPLESLPSEILNIIFSYVTIDQTADPYARPFTDLCSCALVCKNLHAAAVRAMYRHVSIPQSKAFAKFLRSLVEDFSLGHMVQWLDFSHYSNMGFGRARSTSNRTPFLTPTTIKECLDRTPSLQAFLVHEHIDDELDVKVIAKLLRMPSMQALDFTACSSRGFTDSFTTVCTLMPWRDNSMISLGSFSHPLKRLSLHECTTLQEPVFEALLPRLANLTHLDLAHTLINDKALLSIPNSAQITHLNLERCTRLTGSAVVRFLTSHPAARGTMVYLNLSADSSRHRLLSEEDVSRLLSNLPPTIRSLNIGGARVNPTHVPALRKLSAHVEELGLKCANLGYATDITRIFGIEEGNDGSHKSALRYIDLADISSVNQMSLSYSTTPLTSTDTEPLEVIEVGSSVLEQLKKRNKSIKSPEWVVRELGRRGWYVRQPQYHYSRTAHQNVKVDDGSRPWKMGARWWGMRKIPMVEQEVGGMYGYFMFKRN